MQNLFDLNLGYEVVKIRKKTIFAFKAGCVVNLLISALLPSDNNFGPVFRQVLSSEIEIEAHFDLFPKMCQLSCCISPLSGFSHSWKVPFAFVFHHPSSAIGINPRILLILL